ncbi:HypC/HybG/HupF family hydrogenase formation chaperone [Helicobacter pylori]|uniref:HypC/HybG/HupF family hydrogenase formation chaperone n=1 Tax=Helicobacter pylori TaxID=210 RepID=A0AAE7DVP2_HELPX|nr:HypC/HybG/HupF family hydrogenase formation chaperone [Helicobacter pylori]KNE11610.1 hydrogenase assembly protein HupF [Helicobacter pylori]MCQ2648205.1 HypC/HybG/HupF family hydrogenase formation chaperone [Helicobacter pylori]QJW29580.1 HypC/HybG/HupF family hydrogenase formation chaperone [Helicobacter pylori A45]QJW40868.1 HypC/HybG/HupF family hydrogenase formation chaperone [Helicobacter pylori]QJW42327.1 HypC/HybG/HupF family hydrogenase formation chaperone [Helicobacter pylori]
MCLAIPSKVIAIKDNVALLETLGVQREASLDLMGESVKVGDYVLLHIGYVMSKIDEKEALESIALYQEMIAKMNETHE